MGKTSKETKSRISAVLLAMKPKDEKTVRIAYCLITEIKILQKLKKQASVCCSCNKCCGIPHSAHSDLLFCFVFVRSIRYVTSRDHDPFSNLIYNFHNVCDVAFPGNSRVFPKAHPHGDPSEAGGTSSYFHPVEVTQSSFLSIQATPFRTSKGIRRLPTFSLQAFECLESYMPTQ